YNVEFWQYGSVLVTLQQPQLYIDHVHAHYLLLFFFNDPATTEIYTLSLHDALPISPRSSRVLPRAPPPSRRRTARLRAATPRCTDRKSTRLNSSHVAISYAVFCLKKKKKETSE